MMQYFSLKEFDSPDAPGSGAAMDYGVLQMLDLARAIYGRPMIVTSGYRTEEHNDAVNGNVNSSHLIGLACDISCISSSDRFDMLMALLRVGFRRVGIGANFIHVDMDDGKIPDVIWTY